MATITTTTSAIRRRISNMSVKDLPEQTTVGSSTSFALSPITSVSLAIAPTSLTLQDVGIFDHSVELLPSTSPFSSPSSPGVSPPYHAEISCNHKPSIRLHSSSPTGPVHAVSYLRLWKNTFSIGLGSDDVASPMTWVDVKVHLKLGKYKTTVEWEWQGEKYVMRSVARKKKTGGEKERWYEKFWWNCQVRRDRDTGLVAEYFTVKGLTRQTGILDFLASEESQLGEGGKILVIMAVLSFREKRRRDG